MGRFRSRVRCDAGALYLCGRLVRGPNPASRIPPLQARRPRDRHKFLGTNTVRLCELCEWPFSTFYEMLVSKLDSQRRRSVYVLLYSVEHREQGNSLLADELARIFGIPLKVLTTEDLSGETLESLRERFDFDPKEVVRRAANFTY